MSTQPDPGPYQHKDGIEEPMEVPESVLTRSKLHALVVNQPNHLEVTSINEAMKEVLKETLAEGSKICD